ncbi:MAG TPA: FHA domain-containing protein [Patescibacteria group bacterium]|nr:MAG: hypothetical protein A2417_15945 [Bdellovibrionales bacterium RIFOXYC1_FULL_37_79]OFZ57503.1 MAG: hypothetical protein A2381_05585 [Bdellovibrionales bacterium RIFOXYB1_FULL_37_110]OFZ63191.1 MAG: hypothetical protein A2577_08980 [Bdellovibrionales bacterium RIFOXYD1_FULL_36_51]HLD90522.1 FHA domain-containing protein [Patescibacteria group bacterium]
MSDTTRIFIKDLYLIDIKSKHVHSIFDGMKIGRSKLDVSYADDSGLSHEHCKITVEDGKVFLEDFSSSNGTFINNRKIFKAELIEGDMLRIGNQEMIVSASPNSSELIKYPNFLKKTSIFMVIIYWLKGLAFWAGVMTMPYLFAWFTLRKNYSKPQRYAAFSWLILLVVFMLISLLADIPIKQR